jgi:hypothetical protein
VPRLHLFEFEDLPYFPRVWRDLLTDLLAFNLASTRAYDPIVPQLADALRRAASPRTVDLCSGSSATSMRVFDRVAEHLGEPLEVVFSDKYPNLSAFERLVGGRPNYSFEAESVDALQVAPKLEGFRTMFTALHHFRPEQVSRILQDAVDQREPIAIFEFTERRLLPLVFALFLLPIVAFVNTLRIRPLTLRRILWTYVIPVVPLALTWDGVVSCLRSYEPMELHGLVDRLENTSSYRWDIGRTERRNDGFCVTYLIGMPARAAIESPAA